MHILFAATAFQAALIDGHMKHSIMTQAIAEGIDHSDSVLSLIGYVQNRLPELLNGTGLAQDPMFVSAGSNIRLDIKNTQPQP